MSDLSLSVQYCSGEQAAPPRHRVRRLVRAALPDGGEVTVRFVSAAEMHAVGRRHRHRKTADILSFAYHPPTAAILGDILVCLDIAAPIAAARRRRLTDHISHLIVHGALHLAGYHHQTAAAAGTMEDLERAILVRFGIADPYQ